jgi:hypothetical protein
MGRERHRETIADSREAHDREHGRTGGADDY